METKEPAYLGDGVYATYDGEYIWLETQRDNGPERIALDGSVFHALLGYAQRHAGWQKRED